MKILFQGDSITDAGRDRSDPHNLAGYAKFSAELIKARHPATEFEFFDLGIGGNRAENLRDRWTADCIDYQPDVSPSSSASTTPGTAPGIRTGCPTNISRNATATA